jgi:hypothetical protein
MSNLPVRYHCRHVHLSGHRCGSPALRGEPFCYLHHTTRNPAPRPSPVFQIPQLEDRATLQLAIAEVLARIAAGTLDPKRAGLLLYGLQIAQNNLPPHHFTPAPSDTVEDLEHDQHNHPLAPAQEFAAPSHERTLEEILLQHWEEDKALEAQDRATAHSS